MRKLLPLLIVFLLLLGGCSDNGKGKLDPTDIPIENIVSVYIESSQGDIRIEPGGDKTIRIEPTYTITAETKERRELIANNISVSTDTSNPSILTILSRVGSAVTLEEGESAQIDLTVKIPDSIGSVAIQSGEGDITVNKIENREFSIVNQSGNVEVKNTSFSGKSNISNVMGDVKVNLKSIERAQEIRITTDYGDIKLNVPKRADYTVTVEELSQQGSTWKNKNGTTIINLATKVGKIQFQK